MTQPIRPLTDAEQRVADLVGRGLDAPQVAASLNIAVRTVRAHVATIALKLPNPDSLGAYRLVMLWAAHEQWLKSHRKTA